MTLSIPEIPADVGNLEAALLYAESGLYIGPARRASKHPGSLLRESWETKTFREPEQVASWFAGTDHDVFLHAGRSGLIVFDVDYIDRAPAVLVEHLDAAPHQSSRPDLVGRGHYLFAQPPGRSIGNGGGRLGSAWGQVRGRNGVIMLAPSAHQNGGEYRWLRTGEIPVLPAVLAEMLDDGKPGETSATDAEVVAFIAEHTTASRPAVLAGRVKGYTTALEAGNGRHDTTIPFLTGAMEEAAAGLYSAQDAVDAIAPIFLAAVTTGDNKRTRVQADSEFAGLLAWAVAQAKAADPKEIRARVQAAMPDYDEILRNSAKTAKGKTDDGRPPLAKVSTTVLSTVVAEKVRWLWKGRLPRGKLVTLDGDPGLGKSTLAVELIAHITTGDDWPDGAALEYSGPVLVLSAEDGLADTVKPRVDAAGGDSTKVIAVDGVPTGYDDDGNVVLRPLTLADTGAIEAAIVDHGALLAVVDVLMAFLPGGTDSHRDQDVRRVLSQLSTIAARQGCTFLFIRHLTKGSGKGDPMYRGGGSIGIIGAARLGLAVAKDPDDDDRRVLAVVKSNLSKIAPSLAYRLEETPPHDVARVVWDGETEHTAADLLRSSDDGERSPYSQVWLAAFLQDGRQPSTTVKSAAAAEGIRERTLQNAAKRIGVVYTNEGFPRTTYWELPSRAADPQRVRDCATARQGATSDDEVDTDDSPAVAQSHGVLEDSGATGQSAAAESAKAVVDTAVEKDSGVWPLCAAGCGDRVNPIFGDTHSVCQP